MFARGGAYLQFGAEGNGLATQKSEREVFVQPRRTRGAGDEAGLFAVLQQLVAASRKRVNIVGEKKTDELPVHVADGADAIENFLSDVAALRVAHRARVKCRP